MKKWYYVNQQVYAQFTFFVKVESMLEADRVYRQNTIPVKCKFCGTVCTEDENHYSYYSITVRANSIDQAQQLIDKQLEEKLHQPITYREGVLYISVIIKKGDLLKNY